MSSRVRPLKPFLISFCFAYWTIGRTLSKIYTFISFISNQSRNKKVWVSRSLVVIGAVRLEAQVSWAQHINSGAHHLLLLPYPSSFEKEFYSYLLAQPVFKPATFCALTKLL